MGAIIFKTSINNSEEMRKLTAKTKKILSICSAVMHIFTFYFQMFFKTLISIWHIQTFIFLDKEIESRR